MANATHFTILDQSDGNALGVRLQGVLELEDLRRLGLELKQATARSGRLRVLLELKSINNFSPNELWDAMRQNTPEIQQVERLALASDGEDYKRWLAELSTSQLEGEVRFFEPTELRAAWEWIKGSE